MVTVPQRSVRRTTAVHITTQSPETRGRRVETPGHPHQETAQTSGSQSGGGDSASRWICEFRCRSNRFLSEHGCTQLGRARQLPASQMRCTRLPPSGFGKSQANVAPLPDQSETARHDDSFSEITACTSGRAFTEMEWCVAFLYLFEKTSIYPDSGLSDEHSFLLQQSSFISILLC